MKQLNCFNTETKNKVLKDTLALQLNNKHIYLVIFFLNFVVLFK